MVYKTIALMGSTKPKQPDEELEETGWLGAAILYLVQCRGACGAAKAAEAAEVAEADWRAG